MTPLGIEPMTFRLVVQCLNQLRYCVPHQDIGGQLNNKNIVDRISGYGDEQCGYVDRKVENYIQRVFQLWLMREKER